MNSEIPKPVREKPVTKDMRKQYLEAWKKLFESLHPEIQVLLYTDENFKDTLRKITDNVSFETYLCEPPLLILLPEELDLEYIIGAKCNRMFSNDDVRGDTYYWEEKNYPGDTCQPQTHSWKDVYNMLHKKVEVLKQEIPIPPFRNQSLIVDFYAGC